MKFPLSAAPAMCYIIRIMGGKAMPSGTTPLRTQAAALALLAAVVFSNTLDNGFVWDDVCLIPQKPAPRSLRSISRLFRSPFFEGRWNDAADGRGSYWRPLTALSLAIDRALWGDTPFGFHLTNLLLHALNAALVLLLFHAIPRTRAAAFPAAVIFACHPLQTNAVSYISGRTDLLAGLFILLACLITALLAAGPAGPGPFAASLCIAACTALAAASKENSFAAPLLVLATAALAQPARPDDNRVRTAERGAPPRSRWGAPLAGAASSALAVCAVLWCRRRLGIAAPSVSDSSPGVLLAAAEGAALYCRLLFLPAGLHMERFIDIPSASDPAAILAAGAVVLGALIVSRALARGGASPLPLLACWAAAAFLPSSNIIPIYPGISDRQIFVGEQFLYVPMAGLACLIACAWVALRGAAARGGGRGGIAGRIAAATAAAALGLLGVLSHLHNEYWRDERSFYSRTLALSPGSARMNINLGALEAREGNYDEALRLLGPVAAQNPRFPAARLALGLAYTAMGRFDDAGRELNEAERLSPGSPDILDALGALAMASGNYAEAVSRFSSAARAAPLDPKFRIKLAAAHLHLRDPGGAETALRGVLAADPGSAEALMLLGLCREQQGRTKDAFEIYRAIARRHPAHAAARERAARLAADSCR